MTRVHSHFALPRVAGSSLAWKLSTYFSWNYSYSQRDLLFPKLFDAGLDHGERDWAARKETSSGERASSAGQKARSRQTEEQRQRTRQLDRSRRRLACMADLTKELSAQLMLKLPTGQLALRAFGKPLLEQHGGGHAHWYGGSLGPFQFAHYRCRPVTRTGFLLRAKEMS